MSKNVYYFKIAYSYIYLYQLDNPIGDRPNKFTCDEHIRVNIMKNKIML